MLDVDVTSHTATVHRAREEKPARFSTVVIARIRSLNGILRIRSRVRRTRTDSKRIVTD